MTKIGFARTNDKNMYLKSELDNKILLAEFFVDDMIFEGHYLLCKSFANEMKKECKMSMFGEIKFFVGLKVYQMKGGIYITQSKYIKEILETFRMEFSRIVKTPIPIGHKLSNNHDS